MFDARKELDNSTMFSYLLTEGDVSELTEQEGFDPKNLELDLKVNGVQVRLENFNKVMGDWATRIGEHERSRAQQDLDLLKQEQAVQRKAEELILKKFDNILEEAEDAKNALECVVHKLWSKS